MVAPRTRRAFHAACARGDLDGARAAVSAHASARGLSTQCALAECLAAVADDDAGGSALLYLAAGCRQCQLPHQPRSGSGRPRAFDWLAAGPEGPAAASHGSSWWSWWWYGSSEPPPPADAGRAAVLAWVVQQQQQQQQLDFSLVNSRCQGVLHACVLSSSHRVLHLALQAARGCAEHARPSLSLDDADGQTPFGLAVAAQDWPAAAALLDYAAAVTTGSCSSSAAARSSAALPELAAAQQCISALLPSAGRCAAQDAAAGAGGPAGPSGVRRTLAQRLPRGWAGLLDAVLLGTPQQQGVMPAAAALANEPQVATTCSDLAAVAQQLQAAVEQVACVAGVPPATALQLLEGTGFSRPERAIEAALAKQALQRGPDQGSASSGRQGADDNGRCVVCFEAVARPAAAADALSAQHSAAQHDRSSGGGAAAGDAPPTASVELPCEHTTCDDCWLGLISAAVGELGAQRVRCPVPGCGIMLPFVDVERLAGAQLFNRFMALLAQRVVDTSPDERRWCPAPGCGRSLQLLQQPQQGGAAWQQALLAGRGLDVACSCGHRFCWSCRSCPHEPATCQQVVAWQQQQRQAVESDELRGREWVSRHTKPCPGCGAATCKDGGCLHMTCKVCGRHWCWQCSQPWQRHSAATGGFYACTLQAAAASQDGSDSGSGRSSDAASSGPQDLTAAARQPGSQLWRSVLQAVTSAVLDRKARAAMCAHSTHEVDAERLTTLLRFEQLLLRVLLAARQCSGGIVAEPAAAAEQTQAAAQPSQHAAVLPDELLDAWRGCILECAHTLRCSHVLGLFCPTAAQRRYLAHLQSSLGDSVDQLLATVQQLPGAQHVVEAAAAAAAARRSSLLARLSAATAALRAWLWRQLGYQAEAVPAASAQQLQALLARMCFAPVTPDVLARQLCYVVALGGRLADVRRLLQQAREQRMQLLNAARRGAFDAAPAGTGGAEGEAHAASEAPPVRAAAAAQVTALDVLDLVGAGLGQLWRSLPTRRA